MGSMHTGLEEEKNGIDKIATYYAERAKGGVGLIVTGGIDKNIKIWGLQFGDCHKSIFAHDDAITSVKFIPNTHMFFSAGRDGKVKQWDADNFERILTLDGHHGEVCTLKCFCHICLKLC